MLPRLQIDVGDESIKLEEIGVALENHPDEVYEEHADPRRDPWRALVLPALKQMPAAGVTRLTGSPTRSITAICNGTPFPHGHHRERLTNAATDFSRRRLQELGDTTLHDLAA